MQWMDSKSNSKSYQLLPEPTCLCSLSLNIFPISFSTSLNHSNSTSSAKRIKDFQLIIRRKRTKKMNKLFSRNSSFLKEERMSLEKEKN
jgi:hypothetical protein